MDKSLREQVTVICGRLAPLGWGSLFALHGLRLDTSTLGSATKLEVELRRRLPFIDRTVEGFQDYSPLGERAVEQGNPAQSLLYHAFASPLVHPFRPPRKRVDCYPTLEELDTIENYIYALADTSLAKLRGNLHEGARLVVGVFAYQYRIGARGPNGRFAELAFSRAGVARVGTRKRIYEGWRRSFWPVPKGEPLEIATLPSRYGAFLAEWRSPLPQDSVMSEQPGDDDRTFLFPVHKLFNGKECLRKVNLSLKFSELHQNEKLRKVYTIHGIKKLVGFDLGKPPFFRESSNDKGLVRLKNVGASVLVTPVPHDRLTRLAFQENQKTKRIEIARFVVPPKTSDNRFAISSFQYVDPKKAERRPAPEYLNIRHRVHKATRPEIIEDINILPTGEFSKLIEKGGYEAAHYVDDTCEGCVAVSVGGVNLDKPAHTNFAAYSLVSAPDFFPLVDQADVMDWVDTVLGRSGEREHFAQGGPRPLSRRRVCVNPYLYRSGPGKSFAFPVRDPNDMSRCETLTAIVGAARSSHAGEITDSPSRFSDPSTTFLSDAASGIFDPGWDTSFNGNAATDFIASDGLGSPFPEDAKLCAALNSFWPSVAPDATRTFGLFPPEFNATTAIPLMDEELGFHASHPLVLAGAVKPSLGWDGEQGPFFEKKGTRVNHADIGRSDYVTNTLDGKIHLARLAKISPFEFFQRMNAIRACIEFLPEEPKQVSSTRLFLVSAESIPDWATRVDRSDPRLTGKGYVFQFALLGRILNSKDIRRVVRHVEKRFICHIGSVGVGWRDDAKGGGFHFNVTPLFV